MPSHTQKQGGAKRRPRKSVRKVSTNDAKPKTRVVKRKTKKSKKKSKKR